MNRLFVCMLLSSFCVSSFAQSADIANVWLGNTYGNVHDWNDPANWSRGHVPTSEELVFIPDLHDQGQANYPIIGSYAEVGSIEVHPLAQLTIESGGSLYISAGEPGQKFVFQSLSNRGIIYLEARDLNSKYLLEPGLYGDVEILVA